MRFHPLLLAGVFAALLAAPGEAQLRSSRPTQPVVNLPRLMVANPHSFSPQDSSAAVRIGAGLRDRIEHISDRWFKVVQRAQMNEALQQYAYPVDAVLPPMVAQQLATSLSARTMVLGTMLRGEGGRYTVEARLAGVNDDAGQMVRVTQAPNQSFEEFGARVADSLSSAFHALQDARQCESLRQTSPDKAAEAALKALRAQPNDGLAEWCLAQIAKAKKAPVDTIAVHLKNAAKGDPLSLKVWNDLAVQYQAKSDSSAVIETYKQMLRVAPTNEALRKEAFQLFQRYGRPDAAEDVAREGLKIDDKNLDFWDLLFSACIVQAEAKPDKRKCSVDALNQIYALDSAKADTTFFTKMTLALAIEPPDTANLLVWARKGVAKYPGNSYLLGELAKAYSLAGPVDSAVSVTKRLMAVDSSDVTPVLKIMKSLADAKRGREALGLAAYLERLGSADDKGNAAAILARGAFPFLQPPADWSLAADMAREVLKIAPAGSQTAKVGNFVLGISAFQMVADMDKEATSTKSCPMAQQMKKLLEEAGPALLAGKEINEATIAPRLSSMDQFLAHVNSQIKAYCK
jgi:tetratricopeptide (TPR) repeat protein